MAKKIARDFTILFCFAVLCLSTSRTTMQFLFDIRDVDKWYGFFQGNHGDLASMSHLDYVHKFYDPKAYFLKRTSYKGPKNTVLFIHGDSNIWKISDSVFAGVCDYKFIGWSNPFKYKLDKAKRNVLIIEVGERLLREYYNTTEILDEFTDTSMLKKNAMIGPATWQGNKYSGSMVPWFNLDDLFNKNINQNIAGNLFSYKFMTPMFGYKAAINYYLFNRASGDVVISDDRQYLFYKQTIGPSYKGSSFSYLGPDEITHLITNFNTIYDYYKYSGFDQIYLSIVPNTVTILQPKGYNNLIPLIQHDPRLKIPVIDIYSVFKDSKKEYFQHGDTHWNIDGKQKWIDMVNDTLLESDKRERQAGNK